MNKSVEECREASVRVPRVVNGLEAWIFRAERFGTYGVRFYAPGEIFPGFSFLSDLDGVYTAVEKL